MDKVKVEEQLIEEVRECPALFNKAIREYKDDGRKLELWNTIAEKLGNAHTGNSAKKLWESLRSQYVAYARKLKQPSGSGRGRPPYYRHSEALKFLDDFVEPRKTASNIDDSQDHESSMNVSMTTDDDSSVDITFHDENGTHTEVHDIHYVPSVSPQTHNQNSALYGKRKRSGTSNASFETVLSHTLQSLTQTTSEDESDMWLKSLAPALKRLHEKSPSEAALFKLKVQRMLVEAEFPIQTD